MVVLAPVVLLATVECEWAAPEGVMVVVVVIVCWGWRWRRRDMREGLEVVVGVLPKAMVRCVFFGVCFVNDLMVVIDGVFGDDECGLDVTGMVRWFGVKEKERDGEGLI